MDASLVALLFIVPALASAAPPTVGELLRVLPLARRGVGYYTGLLRDGEFGYGPMETAPSWLAQARVLELSAGRRARWSRAVAQAAPEATLVAADVVAPEEDDDADPPGLTRVVADNCALEALRCEHAPFDVIFGGHALCTCEWVVSLPAHANAARLASQPAAETRESSDPSAPAPCPCSCGGVPLSRSGVDSFARGVGSLLTPSGGVAVFDQEGGWPFGLETLLRDAASRHSLHLYVRRGPLLTNVNYVLSRRPLEDDVAVDPLQRSARALDYATILFAPAVLLAIEAFRSGALDAELLPAAEATKRAVSLALMARLVLAYAADVLTARDLLERARPPSRSE